MTLLDARPLFDIPADTVWLNAAYMAPYPRAAAEAGAAAHRAKAAPWALDREHCFFGAPDALRAEAASLFGCGPEAVALVPAVSYGLATAARNLTIEPGREILVLDEQFPSNVYAWRRMAARDGARIRTVARSDNESWTDALLGAVGPQTSLVACPATHWIDGGRIDLVRIGEAVRSIGAKLVLDLTQSLGVQPFDAAAVKPDFAVAAGYKWLLGPYAIGFLYVAPEHRGGEPLEENWINRERSDDFARLVDYQDAYRPGAERFDMGERSNFQLLPAALEAVRTITRFGVESCAAHAAQLSEMILEQTAPLGLAASTPDRSGHYLGLSLPERAPADLLDRLKAHGVHITQRGTKLRVTPHLYNTPEDVARFTEALGAALEGA